MSLAEIYDALRQVMLIADTQKRQEEDIKELKQLMIKFSTELQRISDRIDITDQRSKADLHHLAQVTKLEMENLALKMQLIGKTKALKPKPDDEDDEKGSAQ